MIWKQYSTEPEKWALLKSEDEPVKHAAALVSETRDNRWFAEHYPYMGHWDVFNTIEEAKEWAGCPWRVASTNSGGVE